MAREKVFLKINDLKIKENKMNYKFENHIITSNFFSNEEIQFEVGRWYWNMKTGNYFLCVKRTKFSVSFYEEDECDDNVVNTRYVKTFMLDYSCRTGTKDVDTTPYVYYEFVRGEECHLNAEYYVKEDGKAVVCDFEFYTPEWEGMY